MPPAVATLSECLRPSMGMRTWVSESADTSGRMPSTSWPKTTQTGKFNMKKILLTVCSLLTLTLVCTNAADTNPPPVRIAIWGLVHTHVHGFLPRLLKRSDVQLVGIIEPDAGLCARCAATYKLSPNLFHASRSEER